jgi:hypothetical protein
MACAARQGQRAPACLSLAPVPAFCLAHCPCPHSCSSVGAQPNCHLSLYLFHLLCHLLCLTPSCCPVHLSIPDCPLFSLPGVTAGSFSELTYLPHCLAVITLVSRHWEEMSTLNSGAIFTVCPVLTPAHTVLPDMVIWCFQEKLLPASGLSFPVSCRPHLLRIPGFAHSGILPHVTACNP